MRSRRLFLSAFGLYLLIGVLITYVLGPVFGVAQKFGGTGHDGYVELARHLAAGDGYVFTRDGPPVFHRPPSYPLLLMPFMFLPESWHQPVVIVLNAALVGVLGVSTQRLGWALELSPAQALSAAAVLLANPWLAWSVKNPMSAILQAALYTFLLARLVALWGAARRPGTSDAVVMGLLAAALALSHGTMLPVVLLAILATLAAAVVRQRGSLIRAPLVVLLIVAAAVAPWMYRNYAATGHLVPVTGNAGITYFAGNAHWRIDPIARPIEGALQDRTLAYAGIDRPADEVMHYWGLKDPALEAAVNRAFVRHAIEHPLLLLKKIVLNGIEFYFPLIHCTQVEESICTLENIMRAAYYSLLWSMALAGALLGTAVINAVAFGAIALWVLPYLPFLSFIGHSMYNFGTLPFLALLAGTALGLGLQGWKSHGRFKAPKRPFGAGESPS